ncbi:metallophosphoesterase [Pseudomonas sp. JDS28PS106]|uniref:metallophosphoesterase n=1 Tax=Pseudomonas sp. JDS28PS106 TaxID=2497235 RepID=UPI002FD267E9
MKIHVLSDLHVEFERYVPVETGADLIVLAGDIHTKNRGVEWANQMFNCPVIHILGNHELYGGHLDRTIEKMRLQAAPHVHILECETFIAGDIRFLCATGWTDFTSTGNFAVASSVAREEMNDFRMIRCGQGYRRIRPDDLIARNRATRAWLNEELNRSFAGKTVVVSHHAPIPQVIGYKHEGHLNAAYANAWHDLLPLVDAWIFGHTHLAVDVVMGGCRLVSNPKGYPQEDTGFDPWKLIEI